MTEVKNVDNLIVSDMQQKSGVTPITPPLDPIPEKQPEPENLPEAAISVEIQEKKPAPVEEKPEKTDNAIDEYGNTIQSQEKQKVYTEEEVQRMIRERLARGKHAEPEYQPPIKPKQSDEVNEEDWQTQLNNVIDKRMEERQAQLAEHQWRQQEAQKQADFEARFTNGMDKYPDFKQVISGKPITDTMMMATRALDNPAAFIYGAAKMHSAELDRISKIADPYAQSLEVGRLHEKMVKERKLVSNAPRPLETVNGDMPTKDYKAIPIDQRIEEHAKSKRR
jgi:hypothetical protein